MGGNNSNEITEDRRKGSEKDARNGEHTFMEQEHIEAD